MKKIILGLFAIGLFAIGCEYKDCRGYLLTDYILVEKITDAILEASTIEASAEYSPYIENLNPLVKSHKAHILVKHTAEYASDKEIKDIEKNLDVKMIKVDKLVAEQITTLKRGVK